MTEDARPIPPEQAARFTDVVFLWVMPVFRKILGMKTQVTDQDLPPAPYFLLPEMSARRLEALWAEERENARAQGRKADLKRTIFRMLGPRFGITVALIWTSIILNIAVSVLVAGVVEVVEGNISVERGYMLAAAFFVFVTLAGIFSQKAQSNQLKIAMMASGSLNAVVFRKLALITSGQRGKYTEGQIINYSAVDCQAVLEVTLFLGFFAIVPIQIVVCVVLLYLALGPPFLLGFGILVFNVFAVERVGDNVKKLQVQKYKLADERNVFLNEAMQGIRTIKLLAWEQAFLHRVMEKRDAEMVNLRTTGFQRAIQAFLSFGLPTLATVATFILYVGVGNDLDPAIVFLSVGLFEFLNLALVILPNMINEFRRLTTSVERIEGFLREEELYVNFEPNATDVGLVEVKEGSFYWSEAAEDDEDEQPAAKAGAGKQSKDSKAASSSNAEEKKVEYEKVAASGEDEENPSASTAIGSKGPKLALERINFRATKGQLVAVVGRVSSGKTTFANALLGLIGKASGSVFIGGRTAFVAQQSFVMNDTVRENIVFSGEFDEKWYRSCLKAACLEHDLESFIAGDMTQVGERGITISGGQKQRVALARAAYFKPDVVVLDDPLSAMDAHVGKEIFENLILGLWRRQQVTVILITNQLWVCDQCDEIVLLDDGKVRETGTYDFLTGEEAPGRFRELMTNVTGHADPHAAQAAGPLADAIKAPEEQEEEKKESTADAPEERASRASEESADGALLVDEMEKNEDDEGNGQEEKEGATEGASAKKDGKLMTTEARSTGRVGWRTVTDLIDAADAPFLGLAVLLVTLASPVNQWLVGWALSQWTETYVDDDEDPGEIHRSQWLWIYVGLAGTFACLAAARSGYYNWFFVIASTVLHNKMLGSVFKAPMSLFDTTPVGRILNRFQNDMTILDVALPRLFELWAFLVGVVCTAIILAGILVPPMLPAALLVIAFGVWIYRVVGSVVLDLRKLSLIMASPIVSALGGFINGLDSIRAFGRTEMFARRYETNVGNFLRVFYWMRHVEYWIISMVVNPVVGAYLSLLAFVIILLRDSSFVNASIAGLVLSYAALLGLRVPAIMFISTTLEQLLTSVQRLVEYIKLEPEPSTETKEDSQPLPEKDLEDWPRDGDVSASELTLRYRKELPLVLKGVDFAIRHGERIGIVGRTGAGKSTLSLAAFRMAPIAGGEIKIGGVDVRRVPLEVLRERVGMIPQDAWLFSGTVRENLDPYLTHADEHIYRVLDLVSIGEYVRSLGKESGASHAASAAGNGHPAKTGLDYVVEEKGDNFSSGMVQLLCMARILLRQPKVVFMDEATASVDLETDTAVQVAIRESELGLGNSTLITVAHRLQTVIDFDKILVMSDGKVAEFAHPHKLLEQRDSIFSSLVDDTGETSARELRNRAAQAYSAMQSRESL